MSRISTFNYPCTPHNEALSPRDTSVLKQPVSGTAHHCLLSSARTETDQTIAVVVVVGEYFAVLSDYIASNTGIIGE
jgi:hypothetical protein